jgi:acetoin utilization deacetylase AcuC-like enzyme
MAATAGKVTGYVGHYDCARHDTGWKHPEHQGRLPAITRAVYRDMLALHEPLLEIEARPASESDLRLVHTPAHLDAVRRAVASAAAAGEPVVVAGDTIVSDASWGAALAATGAALTAVEAVLAGTVRNAFAAARPPGHGAGAEAVGGFSLFNNVAIAARHLRERRGLDRVLVVEWGGEGESRIGEVLAGDPGVRVITVSPAGEARRENGADYLSALAAALDRATRDFPPDFFLLAAGFDVLAADPLGTHALEPADVHPLTRLLRERAEALSGGRLVAVLEGGYAPAETGRAVVQLLRVLAGLPSA